MREKDIEHRVCAYATHLGALQFKFVSPGVRGVPDRIYLFDGRVLFLEFKQPGGVLSRLQEIQLERIRFTGVPVRVVESVMQGEQVIFEFIHNRLDM